MKSYRDTALEAKLISYIVRKNHKITDKIERDIFSIKAYRVFFDIVDGHRTTFPKEIMKEMIADRLKNPESVMPYFLKLYKNNIDNISEKNIENLIKKLETLSHLRIALESAEDMLASLEEGNIAETKKIASKISVIGVKHNKTYSGEYLKDFEERKAVIEARMKKPMVGIPTGIKKFDLLTSGVVQGELAILAGESGVGKSIGLENFGIHAWNENYNVLYISIEMPKHQVQFRADSRNTRLLYQKFRKGDFTKEELLEWEKIIENYRKKKKNFFEVVSLPRGCTAAEVNIECERFQDKYGVELDLLIVDYLNIMKASGNSSESSKDWKSQVDIAWDLKTIATDFNGKGLPIWTGNQITDEGEGKKSIKKSHIKYGRGIVEVANMVIGLLQTQDDELEDVMRLQFIKVRDLKIDKPIIIRPNYDIMLLDDEKLRNTHRSFND